MNNIPQFGLQPPTPFRDRPGAYAVIFGDDGKLLVVQVSGTYHLPGGGIDPGEEPMQAAIRESWEEVGCRLVDVEFLGEANQYFAKTNEGPLNKLGFFFRARMVEMDAARAVEENHQPTWLTPKEFLDSTAAEFQKWAVRQATARAAED